MSALGKTNYVTQLPRQGFVTRVVVATALALFLSIFNTFSILVAEADDSLETELAVEISALDPEVLTSENQITISGTVSNLSQIESGPVTLTARMQISTPISPFRIEEWFAGKSNRYGLKYLLAVDIASLPVGASAPFTIEIPRYILPLGTLNDWGPRGLELEATTEQTGLTGSDSTILIWDSEIPLEPTRLAILAPLVPTASEISQAQVDHSSLDRTGLKRLDGLAQLADTPGISLLVDPTLINNESEIVDQILDLSFLPPLPENILNPATTETEGEGEGEPESESKDESAPVTPLNSGLRNKNNTKYMSSLTNLSSDRIGLLPAANADLIGLSRHDAEPLISAAQKSRELAAAKLQEIDIEPSSVDLVSHADFDGPIAEKLGETALILPDTALPLAEELSYTPTGKAELRFPFPTSERSIPEDFSHPLNTVLTEQYLTALLADISNPSANDSLLSSANELDLVQRSRALLAIITRQRPNDPRTISGILPTSSEPNSTQERVLTALSSSRWVTPISLATLLETPHPELPRIHETVTTELSYTTVNEIMDIYQDTQTLASITEDSEILLPPVIRSCLRLSSQTWNGQPNIALWKDNLEPLWTAVQAEPSSTINLISTQAEFPVKISNALSSPVTVRGLLVSSDPSLQIQTKPLVTIAPHSETTVNIPVRAVGSGDVTVTIVPIADDNSPVGPPTSLSVRVRANWESVGTIILIGLFSVILGLGIIRTIRRNRPATPQDVT